MPYDWYGSTPVTSRLGKYEDNGNIQVDNLQGQTQFRINPVTGKIETFGAPSPTGAAKEVSDYDFGMDYGLGDGNAGVIAVDRNASGAPTKFYAGTQGGGGQIYDSIDKAQSSAKNYGLWYSGSPQGKAESQVAPQGNSNPAPQKNGELTVPGYGEERYTQNKGQWDAPSKTESGYGDWSKTLGGPSRTESQWDKTSGNWDQPTASEQTYNGLAGQFGNWSASGLNDVYARETDDAMNRQRAIAGARGMGDSSAAMKASGNLSVKMADNKTKAMQDWAKTGMALAGSRDTAYTNRLKGGMDFAGTADTSERNRLSDQLGLAGLYDNAYAGRINSGDAAAFKAQAAKEKRLNSNIETGIQLGNGLAGMTGNATGAANDANVQAANKAMELYVAKVNSGASGAYAGANDWADFFQALPLAAQTYLQTKKGVNANTPPTQDDIMNQGLAAIESSAVG